MTLFKQIISLFWERKILLVALILVLIILVLAVLLLVSNQTVSQSQPPTSSNSSYSVTLPPQAITVTPIKNAPVISGISPIANSKNIGLFTSISITFARSVSPNDIKVAIAPTATLSPLWQKSNTFLIQTPTTALKPGTSYQVTISYKSSVIKQWYFATISDKQLSTQDQAKLQSIGDKANGDYWKNATAAYPWYNSLPLQTSDYFVYFDLKKKSFIAYLYPNPNNQQMVAILKAEVITDLQAKKIPVADLPIVWNIK